MRSNDRTIEVVKTTNLGYLPTFLAFGQRHLEKEQPTGTAASGESVEYLVPVDLLGLTVSDKDLIKEIASVTFTYRAK